MSLPNRRSLLLAPLALAACGFQPAFGPGGTGRTLLNRVLIDAPSDRDSYLLVRELEERLGRAATPDYGLSLKIFTSQEGLAIDRAGNTRRFNRLGRVDYALRDMTSGAIVTSGTVENFTGYSATGTTVATLAAETDAQNRLMVILADQIVTRLLTSDLA
ncbi:MAG: LPS assembly lipoprotein LptE [Sulfitobacter sp.]